MATVLEGREGRLSRESPSNDADLVRLREHDGGGLMRKLWLGVKPSREWCCESCRLASEETTTW